jgi:hypothetical protein
LNFTLHYIDDAILLDNSSQIVDIKKSLKMLNGFLELLPPGTLKGQTNRNPNNLKNIDSKTTKDLK